MRFRPYPGFTIFAAILFAILCGLGVWQLQRLQWKLALIAQVNGHMTAPPVSLDQALKMDADTVQYRRVALAGRFDYANEAYIFTTGPDGAPVYHVLTPLRTDDGRTLLVDRGAVPKRKLDPATRAAGNPPGKTRLVGVWRVPDPPGWFTPPPDRAHRVWYSRDMAGIAAADHLKLSAPAVIEADATPNPGGWPKGGQTVVTFRNEHLSYAITWFGLALMLFGVWISYHASRGRLAWR
ncbi:MAG TPA: SURF1 family protein [Rhizomicrobium sp.]|jgi:surfeit locus 1 family protein|nr:SURF1 family protein [Rhizomicrobium sp.]